MHAAARALKLRLVVSEVHAAPDLDNAFRAASHRKGQAVMVMQSPTFDAYEDKIVKLGAKYRLPVSAVFASFATNGALLSYGPSIQDMITRSAEYVHRVLQGAKARDLPIQRPTKFDLVVNAKTAKSLGLTINQSIFLRADQVVR